MTDPVAEHQSFLEMRQHQNESTIAFHARLMRHAKLCAYSASDQNQFVGNQLLEGMSNKELMKAARTYQYETYFIIKLAPRNEAYGQGTG